MKIATWNVNGSRAREQSICRWLETNTPDLLLLQEIKCEAASFPPVFAGMGWQSAIVGQKGFNGVAIMAREPLDIRQTRLPGLPDDDAQARYVEVEFGGLRVGNLYLPNGNSNGDAGYAYKLRWMDCLAAHAATLLEDDVPLVLAGDYNVCPEDFDFAAGVLGPDDALVRPETRARYYQMIWSGLTDAVPRGKAYRRHLHFLGLPGRLLGKKPRPADSTMRCYRRPWPNDWCRRCRTRPRVARTSLRTMCPW